VALMFDGTAGLLSGSIALVVLIAVPHRPLRDRLASVAFRVVGGGLGAAWLGYGLALLTHMQTATGSLVGLFLTIIGLVAISVSLLARRPVG
jgi:hypothetical protein